MTKSFLTATAIVALLGFGATAAVAQQSAPTLNAPAIEKAAPVQSGKSATGTMQHKSGNAAAVKTSDQKAKRDSAAACGTIKDKAAQDACVNAHAKNQSAKTPAANQKAATPDKSKAAAPRVGG